MEYLLIALVVWPVATVLMLKFTDMDPESGFDVAGSAALGLFAGIAWPLAVVGTTVALGARYIVRKWNG